MVFPSNNDGLDFERALHIFVTVFGLHCFLGGTMKRRLQWALWKKTHHSYIERFPFLVGDRAVLRVLYFRIPIRMGKISLNLFCFMVYQ
ncbi:hypothetical protein DL98DRAFT_156011 [Cadophora sp. DSE1049]|nr:hypothetical protein DL98DRAFT_156011 [Cadophora sp. DSE1049]